MIVVISYSPIPPDILYTVQQKIHNYIYISSEEYESYRYRVEVYVVYVEKYISYGRKPRIIYDIYDMAYTA